MEGDKDATVDLSVQKVFLSTPSGWRATLVGVTGSAITNYISIHALRVEGDARLDIPVRLAGISIHALRVEGD